MKVVVYNTQEFEKETLAIANAKVHDLTLISNALDASTIQYARGKDVIVVSDRDVLDREILDLLVEVGVDKIITRSIDLNHIDLDYVESLKLQLANTPDKEDSVENIALQTISNLNLWSKGLCLDKACHCFLACSEKEGLK